MCQCGNITVSGFTTCRYSKYENWEEHEDQFESNKKIGSSNIVMQSGGTSLQAILVATQAEVTTSA